MKRHTFVSLLIVGSAICGVPGLSGAQTAGTPPAAEPVQSTFSVGEFAIQMAHALQIETPRTGFTPESAAWALWRSGVRLRAELERPLTESDLASALTQLGFSITASNPQRLVSADKAGTVLSTFVNSATAERIRASRGLAAAGNGGDDFNNGNGKGGKFKRKGPKSPGSGTGDGI